MSLAKLGDKFPWPSVKNIVFLEPSLELVETQKPLETRDKNDEPVNNRRSPNTKEKIMHQNSIQNESAAVSAISKTAANLDLLASARKTDNARVATAAKIIGGCSVAGAVAGGVLISQTVADATPGQIMNGAGTGALLGFGLGVGVAGVVDGMATSQEGGKKKKKSNDDE